MNRAATFVTRRNFVVGAGTVALAAACGANSGSSSGAQTEFSLEPDTVLDDDSVFLQAAFADGFRSATTLAAGQRERAPFALTDGNGLPLVNGAPDQIEAALTGPDNVELAVVLDQHFEGLAVPHYSLLFDPADSGAYTLAAEIDGQRQQLEFMVAEPDAVGLVQIGESLRSVDTPTFEDARGFDPICTRFEPCPFHDVNLANILSSGRPTALLVATPGFCQTISCGPVVDLLIDLDPSDGMDVVHAEVYNEPDRISEIGLSPELLGPAVVTYQLDFEPSFVVADAGGIVTARLDYAFDRVEMAAALATAL